MAAKRRRESLEDPDERTESNEELGVPPDAARSAAEDLAHRGMRKPSSEHVEEERTRRARTEHRR